MSTVPDLVPDIEVALSPIEIGYVRRAATRYATRVGLDTAAVDELVAMLTSPMRPAKTRSSAEKSKARRARAAKEAGGG